MFNYKTSLSATHSARTHIDTAPSKLGTHTSAATLHDSHPPCILTPLATPSHPSLQQDPHIYTVKHTHNQRSNRASAQQRTSRLFTRYTGVVYVPPSSFLTSLMSSIMAILRGLAGLEAAARRLRLFCR
jgi:hypothetical protein